MSLLDDFKENFRIMEKTRTSDGAGGFISTWTEGATISLMVKHDTTIEAQVAEQQGTASTYTFLFDKSLDLDYHDVVKRIKDGQTFRITSPSGEDSTPSMSGLNLGKVTAERWEITS